MVEIDETEVWKKRKGVKGTPSKVKMDVCGCVVLCFGTCNVFKKLNNRGHYRFGPANGSEVLPLAAKR